MVIPENFDNFAKEAAKKRKENQAFLKRLRKLKGGKVDELFFESHQKVFSCIDCLDCAHCCTSTGPLFSSKDIERISKSLKMKPGRFVEQYLRIDEDGDYVLQELPCPFLGADNYCGIYEVRPKACREYPHTDHDKMQQQFKILKKNVEICPAAFYVLEDVKSQID